MKQTFILLCLFTISNISFATVTSTGTGNWSSTGTWDGGAVPSYSDDVVIASGTTVTIDVTAYCQSLTINNTAILQFADATTNYNLTVYGDVKVLSGGTLRAAATAVNGGHNAIHISGSLEISGSGTYTDAVSGRSIYTLMQGAGKHIDALNTDFKAFLQINVPGGSITVNNSFSIDGTLDLYDGTLDNSVHNIAINSNASIWRDNSTALLAAAPIFYGTNQILDYYATMTTDVELPDNLYQIYVSPYSGGSVTLNKNVTASNLIGFDYSNDKLVTAAYTITLTNSASNGIYQHDNTCYIVGNLARAYSTPTSQSFPIGSASAYRPVTINVTAITGSGTITVSQTDAAPASNSLPGGVNKISSVRYWTLTKSAGITAVTANVTLSWGADDGVSVPSDITAVHGNHSTGSWDVADETGGHSGNASSGTVTGNGFTSFSDFTLGTTNPVDMLPVELVAFTAQPTRSAVTLSWKTATETNNFGFDIERRPITDGNQPAEWKKIGFVQGSGTVASPKEYSFTDENLTAGRYAYRLKQIDRNGSFTYSPVAEVEVGLTAKEFRLGQNYPNPFNPTTTIEFTLQEDGRVVLKLFDVTGRELATLLNEDRKAGYYQSVAVDMSRFASGVYFYRLQAGTYTETKKLLLLK